jgi:hypothetical protein
MANLRFTILKELGDEGEKVVLEYHESQFIDKFINNRNVILTKIYSDKIKQYEDKKKLFKKPPKALFTQEEISLAEKEAFKLIVKEFKEKTVSLI